MRSIFKQTVAHTVREEKEARRDTYEDMILQREEKHQPVPIQRRNTSTDVSTIASPYQVCTSVQRLYAKTLFDTQSIPFNSQQTITEHPHDAFKFEFDPVDEQVEVRILNLNLKSIWLTRK